MKNRTLRPLFNRKYTYLEFREWCIKSISYIEEETVNFHEKYEKYLLKIDVPTSNLRLTDIGFFTPKNGGITKIYLEDRGWNSEKISEYFRQKSKKERASISPETIKTYGNCNHYAHYMTKINPATNQFYTEIEARNKIFQKQSKASKSKIAKYKRGEINVNMYSHDFWEKKGLNEIEINQKIEYLKLKIGHSMTLDGYIEKYGIDLGIKKFNDRQERWQKTLNSKTDEEKLQILIKKTKKLPYYSKQATLFFEKLITGLFPHNLEFFWKDTEMHIWDNDYKKLYYYDFTIRQLRTVIEFNGAHCHPSPRLTEEARNNWKCPYTSLIAEEKEEIDKRKKQVAEEKEFDVNYVWTDLNLQEQLENLIKKIKQKLNEID